VPPPSARTAAAPVRQPRAPLSLKALYAEYALCAVGLVPHMIFLVDFVARGLGQVLADGVGAGEPAEVAAIARARARHEKGHRPCGRLCLRQACRQKTGTREAHRNIRSFA